MHDRATSDGDHEQDDSYDQSEHRTFLSSIGVAARSTRADVGYALAGALKQVVQLAFSWRLRGISEFSPAESDVYDIIERVWLHADLGEPRDP